VALEGGDLSGELTNEELIQLYDAMMSNINAQFQLWLTVTFAVIIASHAVGANLSRPLRYLMAVLYLSVSILLMTLMAAAAEFGATGGLGFGGGDRSGSTVLIVALRFLVWILGSMATLIFIFKSGRTTTTSDTTP
jgi:hypothetical protein